MMYASNSSSSNNAHGHDEENSRKIGSDEFIIRSQTATTPDIIMFAYTYRSQFTTITKGGIIAAYKGILRDLEGRPELVEIIKDMNGHLKDKRQMNALGHFADFIKHMSQPPKVQKPRGHSNPNLDNKDDGPSRDNKRRKALPNNMKGPGEEEVNSGEVKGKHMMIGGVDITANVLAKRAELIPLQREITDIHDLMALNFVFSETFMAGLFESELVDQLIYDELAAPTHLERRFVATCGAIAAVSSSCGNYKDKFEAAREKAFNENEERMSEEKEKEKEEEKAAFREMDKHPMGKAIKNYLELSTPWNLIRTNEGTYQENHVNPILKAYFASDNSMTCHYINDRLFVPEGHDEDKMPDFFVESDRIPVAIAEVKKPGDAMHLLLKDRRKLLCMMKLAINLQVQENVAHPAVIGFLIQDGVWEVFRMKLPFEAVYIPKKLGQFDVPMSNGGIAGLIGALPLMAEAQKPVQETVKAISRRRKTGRNLDKAMVQMTRKSFYLGDGDDKDKGLAQQGRNEMEQN
ncbi:MAG: hypothetical protein J3Q66DRAFT_194997 [Benniella sp.]|nr:MAG: hypothetical protein J3Q66DRAFT_194997 [Benniella sp.]